MWRVLLGLVFGVLLIVIGTALASDYRGVTTKHVDLSTRFIRPLNPFRSSDDRIVRRRARFVLLDRFIGALIVLAGVGGLAAAVHLLLGEYR
ncbi:hypothetical protein [Verrucosispora sp. NA02020]|uniref:hypothetical protein n=1 Tax=Verrucosispora sp. NA02020 TaxID=2742132 RepID=UPI0015927FC1|nr:hypothetical protein [Verrucosispora sp. NA02020]QKW14103.1 hypothetical protein HUT12_15770 [Verrucosispora sp. NA02020]